MLAHAGKRSRLVHRVGGAAARCEGWDAVLADINTHSVGQV